MDMQPRFPHEQDADSIEKARERKLGRHVRKLENHLKSHWFDTKKSNRLLKKVNRDVGEGARDKKANLLAVGYTYDASGYVDPTPVIVSSEEAYYQGVTIRQVDGDDRVLLSYEVRDTKDDTAMWPYLIPPSAILHREVDKAYQHQAFEYIANSRLFTKKMFESSDFFHLNPEQQHTLLHKQVAEEMIADFSVEYDEDTPVAVGCRYYYQLAYDETDSVDWNKRRYEAGTLEGSIVSAVYLESLQDTLPHIANMDDFTYGQGLPCLVLTNDEHATISLIPVASITAFSSASDMQ